MKRVLAAIALFFAVAADAAVVEPEGFVNLVQTTPGKYACDDTGAWYDGNLGTRWVSGYYVPNPETGETVDSCITFGDNRIVVNAYRFYTAESNAAKRSPKRWKFYGRRFPGEDWFLLDERTDEQGLETGVWKLYTFNNEIACSAFKFVVTEKPTTSDLFSLYEVAFHYLERTDEFAVRGNAPMIDGVGHYNLASGDTVTIKKPASPTANPATGDRYTLQGFRIVDFAGNEIATGMPGDLPYTYTHEGAYRRFEWIWDGQYEALAETLNVDITEPSKSGVNVISQVANCNTGATAAFNNDFTSDGFKWLYNPSMENPCWLSYQFLTGPRVVSAFKLYQKNAARYIADFELQGSNDGTEWTTLHQVANAYVDDSAAHQQLYRVSNHTPYDCYRILITKTKSGATGVQIEEVELFEHALTDALRITGYPQSVGVPAPFYGYTTDLSDGQQVVCSAPTEPVQVGDETLEAVGYQLRVGGVLDEVVSETTCTYTHQAGTAAELRWIFGVKTSQRIEVKGNGTVSPATFSAEDGEEVTVTATPGANSFFAYWEGDVPEGMERNPVLTFTVQGKMNIAAVFGSAYYVKPGGDDAKDGLSRATAFATMPHALAVAANADKVFVASGTYEMPDVTIEINDPISLIGEDGPEATILQAMGEKHRLLDANDPSFLMSGFTLTGGEAADNLGGALRLVAGTVTNCVFYGNKSAVSGGRGGAVFLGSADALLTCSVVTNNSASSSGGGVFALNGRIERCYIEGNTASGSGGGVYLTDGEVVQCTLENNTSSGSGGGVAGSSSTVGMVSNCVFRNCRTANGYGRFGGGAYNLALVSDCTVENCSAGRGGGLSDISTISHCLIRGCTNSDTSAPYFLGGGGYYSEDTATSMDNTLLAENESVSGGGAIASKPSVHLQNVTIAGNRGSIPAVSLYKDTAYLSAVNSIIAYNSDLNSVTNGVSCTTAAGRAFSKLDHSCVFDDSFDAAVAEWSIKADPLFNRGRKADLPHWSLRGVSPCKNAGARLDYAADDVDLAGCRRVIGSRPDMGCYECAPARAAVMVK